MAGSSQAARTELSKKHQYSQGKSQFTESPTGCRVLPMVLTNTIAEDAVQ